MNILPKKSWHVRTKKNIDRVRKDEAEAASKEKELQKRAKVAELEASLDVLRKKNNADVCDVATGPPDVIDVTLVNPSGSSGAGHLNLFRDIEIHEGKLHGTNAEAEIDKKREAEAWEKKVGILQYLGQSTSEEPRFYQKNEKTVEQAAELSAKQQRMKDALDPMTSFPKYAKSQLHMVPKKRRVDEYLAERKIDFAVPSDAAGSSKDKSRRRNRSASSSSTSGDNSDLCRKRSRKRKKHSKHKSQTKRRKSPSSESDPESEEERKKRKKANLEILRRQRLEREERERKRTQEFLSSLAARPAANNEEDRVESERGRRYNSQYNPHLARY